MKSNRHISREVTNKALSPIVDYCRLADVGVEEIRTRLNAKIKLMSFDFKVQIREIRWAQVQSWLHPDPTKRTEPLYGIGALLLEVWNDIQRERSEQKKEQLQ